MVVKILWSLSFVKILPLCPSFFVSIENGSKYVRYGCAVKPDQRAFNAWKSFVNFLSVYTDVSERDSGNISVGSY